MSSPAQPQPHAEIPLLAPAANPRAIRAALLPQERADFDAHYRRAMTEAMDTLDINGVLSVRGERVDTVPWPTLRAELGM